MRIDLDKALIECAIAAGASKIGIADITSLPSDARHGLPVGVSIAVALTPSIVEGITDGPTLEYSGEYEQVNALLDAIAAECADLLKEQGYNAIPMLAVDLNLDRQTLSTPLPHKTTATLASMGWIGKCALLVTDEFGSAVRLTTLLTDAPLLVSEPTTESRCGDCNVCTSICPGLAPNGTEWKPGVSREDVYDVFACFKAARGLSQEQGIPHILCGKCIVNCPWTIKYLDKFSLPQIW